MSENKMGGVLIEQYEGKNMDDVINGLDQPRVFILLYIMNAFRALCSVKPNTFFTVEEIYNSILIDPLEHHDVGEFTVEHLKKIFYWLDYFHFVEEKDGKFAHRDSIWGNLSIILK